MNFILQRSSIDVVVGHRVQRSPITITNTQTKTTFKVATQRRLSLKIFNYLMQSGVTESK